MTIYNAEPVQVGMEPKKKCLLFRFFYKLYWFIIGSWSIKKNILCDIRRNRIKIKSTVGVYSTVDINDSSKK